MQDVTKQSAIILDGMSLYCLCRDRSECSVLPCPGVPPVVLWSAPAVCGGKVSSFAGLRRPGQSCHGLPPPPVWHNIDIDEKQYYVAQYSEKAHGEAK